MEKDIKKTYLCPSTSALCRSISNEVEQGAGLIISNAAERERNVKASLNANLIHPNHFPAQEVQALSRLVWRYLQCL